MESTTRSLSLLTTQSLLGHARAGNGSAWKVLLVRYEMSMRVRAARRLGPGPDAEDVVQNVFQSLLSSLERFEYRDEGSFRRYLFRLVANRCHDLRRTSKTFQRADLTQLPHPASARTEDRESLRVADALNRLSGASRELVLLRNYESKSWKEVCEVLGEPESTVRRRYARAIDTLRGMLA